MAISRKDEKRALDTDEFEMVEKSHHPAVQELGDAELTDLIRWIRERRDRAQSQAHRRRREMRGKSDPRGARASTQDAGSRLKTEVLAMAMRRLNGERERREKMAAQVSLVDNARKALELRQGASGQGAPENARHAHAGMRAVAAAKQANRTPGKKIGSVSQQNKAAQARRDSR